MGEDELVSQELQLNTFPLNFQEMEDSVVQPVVNGFLMVGAWQFKGYDENGLLRSLKGRLTGVHKVLCSAAEIASRGKTKFLLGT